MADWRVLIVEADQRVAATHRRVVRAQPGFQVAAVVSTSDEAYTLLRRGVPVDLLLLDIGLPKADGVALLRALRHQGGPEAVVVTSAREPRIVQDLLHLGVVDYLVKPFAVERLQEALLRSGDRMRTLGGRGGLSQWQIDLLYANPRRNLLPKNLQRDTLNAVRLALRSAGDEFSSAEEIAKDAAVARVTARRYLEYLVRSQQAELETSHHGPGRPRKLYRLVALDG